MPRGLVHKQNEFVEFCQQGLGVADEIPAVAGRILPIYLPTVIRQGAVDAGFPLGTGNQPPGTGTFLGPHSFDRDLIVENALILRRDCPATRFPGENVSIFLLKKRFGRPLWSGHSEGAAPRGQVPTIA